jgi:hypothetical protein
VRFERVPVHYGSLLCITDILLNATAKGVVVANVHSEVYATATITEGVKQLRISGNGATVGTVRHSLLFSPSRPPARLAKESVIEGELLGEHACISYLNFKPAFPHALRSRSNEAARLGGSVSEIQF